MKQLCRLFLLTMLISMVGAKAYAYDIAVENADGVIIYYNYINDGTELEVTDGSYEGSVVIPDEVSYMNTIRKVTSIGQSPFKGCTGLTSVTIPNSVTHIGDRAFEECTGLKKVVVPDIAAWCSINFTWYFSNPLYYANHLYSDDNTEIKDLIIPNNVTSIGKWAFRGCSSLTSITIPNSVTIIDNYAFEGCTGLTSVNIPNSVTSIEHGAFKDCTGLTSVNIPNSMKTIGGFEGCTGLTSVTIPNSVMEIDGSAFSGCTGLTSVTIPNCVMRIGNHAFSGCTGLTSITIPRFVHSIGINAFEDVDFLTIFSLIENPSEIEGKSTKYRSFSLNTFVSAKLYVPKGTINKYRATKGWWDFLNIEESIDDGIAQISADAVLIQTNGGTIIVKGVDDGTQIQVYGTNGIQAGMAVSQNGVATINTSLQPGSVAIVKIGDRSEKVVVE